MSNEEIWKEVPDHFGLKASSWGRLLLPPTSATMPNGGVRYYETAPTVGTWETGSGGKGRYILSWRRLGRTVKVAQLVCAAFHGPKPFPKAVVMHMDEDSRNNRSDNLQWGTQKQNLNAPGFLAYCRARTGDNSPTIKGKRRKAEASTPIEDDHETQDQP